METIMKKILTIALLGGMLALLAGCPSAPVKPETPVENRDLKDVPKPPDGANGNPTTQQEPDQKGLDPINDPKNILSKRSIYFDYDKFDIQDKYRSLIEAHARYIASRPDRKLLIQGNCDERGSREYNLALGQKRADAAKKALLLLGAKDSQIEAVSLGEEKPRALGKDEASYAENRRDDLLYNGE
jgi:peptidoglycan-associated lipoprotein